VRLGEAERHERLLKPTGTLIVANQHVDSKDTALTLSPTTLTLSHTLLPN
jgi:hypothetical protein